MKWYDYFIPSICLTLAIVFTILSIFTSLYWCVGTISSLYVGGVYTGFRLVWLDK